MPALRADAACPTLVSGLVLPPPPGAQRSMLWQRAALRALPLALTYVHGGGHNVPTGHANLLAFAAFRRAGCLDIARLAGKQGYVVVAVVCRQNSLACLVQQS